MSVRGRDLSLSLSIKLKIPDSEQEKFSCKRNVPALDIFKLST